MTVGFIGYALGLVALNYFDAEHLPHRYWLVLLPLMPLLDWLPSASLSRFYLLYPDPWPKMRHWKRRFVDAGNIARSPAVVVIGVESNPVGLNCGFCGKASCETLEAGGGVCTFNSIDLGIATASAAEMAGRLHVDNRVMYSIGRASLDLGWFGPKVTQALGIPLSVTGKSPFFDR